MTLEDEDRRVPSFSLGVGAATVPELAPEVNRKNAEVAVPTLTGLAILNIGRFPFGMSMFVFGDHGVLGDNSLQRECKI